MCPPTVPSSGASTDKAIIERLIAANNPNDVRFDPTVFVSWDVDQSRLPPWLYNHVLQPYIRWARTVVRNQNDVVMLTHLILYFTTSVPSAIYLFYNFSWMHGILHWVMQSYYVGTYTLMMHQHIHMRGILSTKFSWLDTAFPYITDPLMGHTWNSYYFHHVKHHHVEGNGPDDKSSTLRYQRDDIWNLLHYIGRFYFFVWYDLFSYFISKKKYTLAAKAAVSEVSSFAMIAFFATYVNTRAAFCVFLLPLGMLRVGLMVGNWGQHAFVDDVDPDSDFRSSITLIDVPVSLTAHPPSPLHPSLPPYRIHTTNPFPFLSQKSNRYCYNDGYHTSHHLNPLRHWRDHPPAFLSQKHRYAAEHALTFRNIDYIMLTFRLLKKDYEYLARCLVPMGEQVGMSLGERAEMLRRKTRAFGEREIEERFGGRGVSGGVGDGGRD